MGVIGLDHVQVAAPRSAGVEEEARAFYGGLLGLPEIEKPDALKPKGGVWFSLGRGELHVGLEDDFRPARKAHPALVVEDVDGLRQRIEVTEYETADAEEGAICLPCTHCSEFGAGAGGCDLRVEVSHCA